MVRIYVYSLSSFLMKFHREGRERLYTYVYWLFTNCMQLAVSLFLYSNMEEQRIQYRNEQQGDDGTEEESAHDRSG